MTDSLWRDRSWNVRGVSSPWYAPPVQSGLRVSVLLIRSEYNKLHLSEIWIYIVLPTTRRLGGSDHKYTLFSSLLPDKINRPIAMRFVQSFLYYGSTCKLEGCPARKKERKGCTYYAMLQHKTWRQTVFFIYWLISLDKREHVRLYSQIKEWDDNCDTHGSILASPALSWQAKGQEGTD